MDRTEMAGHLIRRLGQQSTQMFQAHVLAQGIEMTSVQFAALDAIHDAPDMDQARLAATIGYDRATIGGVVERLEQKGLLERKVSPTDRRARVLRLSPEGVQVLTKVRPVVITAQAEILGPLSPEERATFLRLARKALGLE